MRWFRDRDFIQTIEDFFFCVVGSVHPEDRVISYLKYIPNASGLWGKGEKRFKRVMQAYTIPSLLETFALLRTRHPQYMFHSRFYNIDMTAVPLECVKKHLKPEEKLSEIFAASELDSLQRKIRSFAKLLSEESGASTEFFGVTGSVLLDIHKEEFSDIDITVYGLENSLALKKALIDSLDSPNFPIKRFEGILLKTWCEQKVANYPLTCEEAMRIYERKWNLGVFEGTPFSIHPVKLEGEVNEKYGDKSFKPLGSIVVHATVIGSKDSLFLPATYRLNNVEVIEAATILKEVNIEEVVSYESLYDNLAEAGDAIEAKGKLELVKEEKTGQTYHRVLVGSSEGKGKEYIKLA